MTRGSSTLPASGEVLPAVRRPRGATEAVRAFYELATGTPVPSVEEDPHWQLPAMTISVPLMNRLTVESLATLRAASLEGNARAAMYLVDRGLGAVGESFEERAARFTLDQAKRELVETLTKLGMSQEQIDGYVLQATQPALTEGETCR